MMDQSHSWDEGGVGLRATEAFLESPSFLYRLMTYGSRRPWRILLRLVPLREQWDPVFTGQPPPTILLVLVTLLPLDEQQLLLYTHLAPHWPVTSYRSMDVSLGVGRMETASSWPGGKGAGGGRQAWLLTHESTTPLLLEPVWAGFLLLATKRIPEITYYTEIYLTLSYFLPSSTYNLQSISTLKLKCLISFSFYLEITIGSNVLNRWVLNRYHFQLSIKFAKGDDFH